MKILSHTLMTIIIMVLESITSRIAVPIVLVNLVSRPTPGLDIRVTSTPGGTGPTSNKDIVTSSIV